MMPFRFKSLTEEKEKLPFYWFGSKIKTTFFQRAYLNKLNTSKKFKLLRSDQIWYNLSRIICISNQSIEILFK